MQDSVPRDPMSNGFWVVHVVEPGVYEFVLRSRPSHAAGPIGATRARVQVGEQSAAVDLDPTDSAATLRLALPAGVQRLQTEFTQSESKSRGAYFVEVRRLEVGK
jgi:hypothetical protein